MVLRSSPWESRTSLTNKGHFASRGRGGRPARGIQLTIQPIFALHRTLSLRLASAPRQGLHVTDVEVGVVKDSARYLTLPYARHAMTQILQQHYVQLASQSLMCPRVHT